MNITAEQQEARVRVTILRLQGDLDGSNYLDLIAKAKETYQNGAKNLLLDLGGVPTQAARGWWHC
jgi:anti-anti-sigma regulatory factor